MKVFLSPTDMPRLGQVECGDPAMNHEIVFKSDQARLQEEIRLARRAVQAAQVKLHRITKEARTAPEAKSSVDAAKTDLLELKAGVLSLRRQLRYVTPTQPVSPKANRVPPSKLPKAEKDRLRLSVLG